MVCQVCGGTVGMGQRFCSTCGTRVALEPPPLEAQGYVMGYPPGFSRVPQAPGNKVARQVRTLGILWCIYGGLRLIQGLVGMLILRTMTMRGFGSDGWPFGGGFHPGLPPWMSALVPLIAVATVVGTVLAFATGYALLTRRPWGRTLAIVAAVLTLIKLPLGTALGIYTLVVLAPAAAGVEYEEIAERSRL